MCLQCVNSKIIIKPSQKKQQSKSDLKMQQFLTGISPFSSILLTLCWQNRNRGKRQRNEAYLGGILTGERGLRGLSFSSFFSRGSLNARSLGLPSFSSRFNRSRSHSSFLRNRSFSRSRSRSLSRSLCLRSRSR